MKVLVAPSWYPPSGGGFFQSQIRQLAQYGYTIYVVALHWIDWRNRHRHIPNLPTKWQEEHHFIYRWPRLDAWNIRRWISAYEQHLCRAIKTFRPDIIYGLSALPAGIAVAKMAPQFGIPYVIAEHRGRFLTPDTDPIVNQFATDLQLAFQQARRVAAVSQILAQRIYQWASLNVLPTVIPNAVDPSHFSPAPFPPKPPFTFLTVGWLHPVKGIDIALKAFAKVHWKHPSTRWHVVGNSKGSRRFTRQIQRKRLAKAIHLHGVVPHSQMPTVYHQAHALMVPSRLESFCVAAVEALMCGRPVVATQSGGPEEIIRPPNEGILTAIHSDALTEGMIELMNRHSNFDPINLHHSTVHRFSPEVIIPRLAEWLSI